MAKDGEKFVSLEDKEYMLDDKSLGICDEEGVQCLGGIMGGAAKGCCDETQNVFLECALFTPECIARTGRKFGIDSDSRYRYERWVDPKSNILGSDYATQMIWTSAAARRRRLSLPAASRRTSGLPIFVRPD